MSFNRDGREGNRQRRRLRSRSDDTGNNTRASTRTARGNGSEDVPWVQQFEAELNRFNAWLTAYRASNDPDNPGREDAAAGVDDAEGPDGEEDPNDEGEPDRSEGSRRPIRSDDSRRSDYSDYSHRPRHSQRPYNSHYSDYSRSPRHTYRSDYLEYPDNSDHLRHPRRSRHPYNSEYSDYSDHSRRLPQSGRSYRSDDSDDTRRPRRSGRSYSSEYSEYPDHSRYPPYSSRPRRSGRSYNSDYSGQSDYSCRPRRSRRSSRRYSPRYSRYSRRSDGPDASEHERHDQNTQHQQNTQQQQHAQQQQHTQVAEASRRSKMEMSALERAAGGDFDAALADYEAQERRFARARAEMAQQRALTQQSADDNDPGFVITEPFDFDAFMKKACGEEDDESKQPAAGNVQADTGVEKSNHSSNIPDVATGIHDPNSPFAMAGVPFQWDFGCIHRDTVSNANPAGDSLWPNPGGAFNPQDYPIPGIPTDAPNAPSSVPAAGDSGRTGNAPLGVPSRNANPLSSAFSTTLAPTDHPFSQTERNHPDAFPAAPTSRGALAAVDPFKDSGQGRVNERGPSSRRSSRGFDKLDHILLSGSGPLKQGTPFRIPASGGLVQPGYQFTTTGLSNQIPSYPSSGRNLPLRANRLTNNPLNNPNPSSSVPVGANPGQTSNQATGSGLSNPDPNAPSATPAAQQVNRRKRRLTAQELARRVKASLE